MKPRQKMQVKDNKRRRVDQNNKNKTRKVEEKRS